MPTSTRIHAALRGRAREQPAPRSSRIRDPVGKASTYIVRPLLASDRRNRQSAGALTMIETDSVANLKAAIEERIRLDERVLTTLREEIWPLKSAARRIQPRATTSISL